VIFQNIVLVTSVICTYIFEYDDDDTSESRQLELMQLTCIQEVPSLNLGWGINYLEHFVVFLGLCI
jgi:hypothetical protein